MLDCVGGFRSSGPGMIHREHVQHFPSIRYRVSRITQRKPTGKWFVYMLVHSKRYLCKMCAEICKVWLRCTDKAATIICLVGLCSWDLHRSCAAFRMYVVRAAWPYWKESISKIHSSRIQLLTAGRCVRAIIINNCNCCNWYISKTKYLMVFFYESLTTAEIYNNILLLKHLTTIQSRFAYTQSP